MFVVRRLCSATLRRLRRYGTVETGLCCAFAVLNLTMIDQYQTAPSVFFLPAGYRTNKTSRQKLAVQRNMHYVDVWRCCATGTASHIHAEHDGVKVSQRDCVCSCENSARRHSQASARGLFRTLSHHQPYYFRCQRFNNVSDGESALHRVVYDVPWQCQTDSHCRVKGST